MEWRDQNTLPLQFLVQSSPEPESTGQPPQLRKKCNRLSKKPPDLENKISECQGQDGILAPGLWSLLSSNFPPNEILQHSWKPDGKLQGVFHQEVMQMTAEWRRAQTCSASKNAIGSLPKEQTGELPSTILPPKTPSTISQTRDARGKTEVELS